MSFPKRSELFEADWNIHDGYKESWICYVEISIDRGKRKSVGYILSILTNSETHPHGIKVEIDTGEVGRVQRLLSKEEISEYKKNSKKEIVETLGGTIPESFNEETSSIEYKQTFSFDVDEFELREQGNVEAADGRKKSGKLNDVKKEVAVAASAFANQTSGILEIGKTDDGKISGYFQRDLEQYKNFDEYTRAIIDSIKTTTKDTIFANSIKILNEPGHKDYLRLGIERSKTPVFIRGKNNNEEFYVRSSAAAKSQKLTPAETVKYIIQNFPDWKG